ncbi:mannosyltransferase putative-domain-containing protein [Chytriomyces cf. hyalinus JEL632]|nr:mannosyltransferase putative-domain-containing protein [Chytriomyces cf. hyalinus JEL632]
MEAVPTSPTTAKSPTTSKSPTHAVLFLATISIAVLFVTVTLLAMLTINPGSQTAHSHLVHTTGTAQGDSSQPPNPEVNAAEVAEAVDLAQIRFIDYMNGELDADNDKIFGGSLQDLPEGYFNLTDTWNTVNTYSNSLVTDVEYDRTNFGFLVRRARSLFIAYRVLNEMPDNEFDALAQATDDDSAAAGNNQQGVEKRSNRTSSLKQQLETAVAAQTETLYSWINPPFESLAAMNGFFKSAKDPVGIALTGGSKHYYLMMHQILSLREEFNITLPIHIFYAGPEDMNATCVATFNAMENVQAVDLLQIFPNQTKLQDRGYSMKPFAILAAPFRTVLFIDADALFFKSPLHALESRALKETGHLFFHDRFLREESGMRGPDFFNEVHKHLSRYGQTIGFPNAKTRKRAETHELDSGFLVLNKSNTGVLFSLLLASKMNSMPFEKDVLYGHTHGDKESFWFASEMLRVPYQFNSPYGGAIGTLRKMEGKNTGTAVVCSAFILQLDEKRELFWWNGGGVLSDRYVTTDFGNHFAEFTHVALDFDGVGTKWFDFFPGGGCVKRPSRHVMELSAEHQALMERYRQRFLHSVKDPVTL